MLFKLLFFFLIKNFNFQATTGKLFQGDIIRKYTLQNNNKNYIFKSTSFLKTILSDYNFCDYWGVTTTIFNISEAINVFLQLPKNYCIIVIGDLKTPDYFYSNLKNPRLLFLNSSVQKKISENDDFMSKLPWNSFARKNIGYIVAIIAKAKAIWDMDDDNIINSKSRFIEIVEKKQKINQNLFKVINCTTINPLSLFTSNLTNYIWPRGFPLEIIKTTSHNFEKAEEYGNIFIWQSLADNDPDVDAIFRLTKNHKIFFAKNKALIIQPYQYSPLNAQASIFFPDSYFTLFLPYTVHGRVSDIWRGYIAQTLISNLNGKIIISSPLVIQKRNSHNYLADFISEKNLYEQSSKIIDVLKNLLVEKKNLNIEDIYISLYERGFIDISDVHAAVTWSKFINFLK